MADQLWWMWLVGAAVGVYLFYYLTRLAVRHGMQDVKRLELEDADRAAVRAARAERSAASHVDEDGL